MSCYFLHSLTSKVIFEIINAFLELEAIIQNFSFHLDIGKLFGN